MPIPPNRILLRAAAASALLVCHDVADADVSPAGSPSTKVEGREATPDRAAALAELKRAVQAGRDVEAAAARARAAGVAPQTVAELRLFFALRSRALDTLSEISAEVEKLLPQWRAEDAIAFDTKEDLEGAMFFARALLAAKAENEGEFEDATKAAFWASPALASVLADEIKTRRRKRHTATLVLPMAAAFETSAGQKTSLKELAQGQKALLLDFWASWCGPCIQLMPDLARKAKDLAPQQVRVVGINTEANEGGPAVARKKAEDVKNQKKIEFAWLVEPADHPLSKLLSIEAIPHATLVTPEGKVLFDGHPADQALSRALEQIGIRGR
jgi:thiol-disulfide isomerase/thioredoxin